MDHPPPPQSNTGFGVVQPVITSSRPPKKCMRASIGVGIAAVIVGIAITAVFLALLNSVYHQTFVIAILPGPLLIVTGILGITYGSRGNRRVAVAYLVSSIITLIASTIPTSYELYFWSFFSFWFPTLAVGAILEFSGLALAITSVVIASVVACCSKRQDQVQYVQIMQACAPTEPQHTIMQPSVQASAPGYGKEK